MKIIAMPVFINFVYQGLIPVYTFFEIENISKSPFPLRMQ